MYGALAMGFLSAAFRRDSRRLILSASNGAHGARKQGLVRVSLTRAMYWRKGLSPHLSHPKRFPLAANRQGQALSLFPPSRFPPRLKSTAGSAFRLSFTRRGKHAEEV
jgi:hypothetical protein